MRRFLIALFLIFSINSAYADEWDTARLDRLRDTYIDQTTLADGNLVQYDAVNVYWKNVTVAAAGGGTFLKLDQSTPQDISNGQPDFLAGLRAGSTNQLSIDTSGNFVTTGTLGAGVLTVTTIDTGSGAMDLGDAAVANGDTNSVPTGDQVYDFVVGGWVAGAGVFDLGGATSFEVPNSAAPTTDATGEIAVDTNTITQGMAQIYLTSALAYIVATTNTPADNQIPKYDSAGGTIQWEADAGYVSGDSPTFTTITTTNNIKSEPKHLRCTIVDPLSVQTEYGLVCLWPLTDAALTVTKIEVTLDAAANEVAGDLKYADTFIGLANATVINDFDTTSGVRSDSTITSGAVASGKTIYLSFDSAPSTVIHSMSIDVTWDYD